MPNYLRLISYVLLSFAILGMGSLVDDRSSTLRAQSSDENDQSSEDRNAPPISPQEYGQKLRLAEVYEETRDPQNAARIYLPLYHLNPADETVFDGLTRSLVYLKRYDEAEKIVKQRMAQNGSLDMLLLYARLEARMNKRPEALDAFHKAETAINAKDCSQLSPIVYAMMDVSYNQDALEVLADSVKLRQILLNVVGNSIKFTPPHGRIELSAALSGDRVMICVSDSGIGIPPDKIDRVFEPFFQVQAGTTRKYDGVGLGLAISRDFVQAMGGDIRIRSAPGKGCAVTIDLPVLD